jgi:hypothetical protein
MVNSILILASEQQYRYTKMIGKKYTVNSVDSTNLGISDITATDTTAQTNMTVYSFTIGEVQGVVYLVPQDGVSHVVFEALNNFVQSLEDAETNFNAHTFFRFIMAALIHHQTETEIVSLVYKTKSAQKHRIYQLMSTRMGIPSVNEWESQMTEGGVD